MPKLLPRLACPPLLSESPALAPGSPGRASSRRLWLSLSRGRELLRSTSRSEGEPSSAGRNTPLAAFARAQGSPGCEPTTGQSTSFPRLRLCHHRPGLGSAGGKTIRRRFSRLYRSLHGGRGLGWHPARTALAPMLFKTADGLTVSEFRLAQKMFCHCPKGKIYPLPDMSPLFIHTHQCRRGG